MKHKFSSSCKSIIWRRCFSCMKLLDVAFKNNNRCCCHGPPILQVRTCLLAFLCPFTLSCSPLSVQLCVWLALSTLLEEWVWSREDSSQNLLFSPLIATLSLYSCCSITQAKYFCFAALTFCPYLSLPSPSCGTTIITCLTHSRIPSVGDLSISGLWKTGSLNLCWKSKNTHMNTYLRAFT